jgi:hypothetical protein
MPPPSPPPWRGVVLTATVALSGDATDWSVETSQGVALRASFEAAILLALDVPGARALVLSIAAGSARVRFGVSLESSDGTVERSGGSRVAAKDIVTESNAALVTQIESSTGLTAQSAIDVTEVQFFGAAQESGGGGGSSSGTGGGAGGGTFLPTVKVSSLAGTNDAAIGAASGAVAGALALICSLVAYIRRSYSRSKERAEAPRAVAGDNALEVGQGMETTRLDAALDVTVTSTTDRDGAPAHPAP